MDDYSKNNLVKNSKQFMLWLSVSESAKQVVSLVGGVLVLAAITFAFVLAHDKPSINLALVNSASPSASPLVYGTNLSMDNSNDQFLTNSGAAAALQSLHAQLIRMPMRDCTQLISPTNCAQGLVMNDYTIALNKIKQIGATPLIIIHGAGYGKDPYPVNLPVLQLAKSIFPTQTVYVDVGNEEDLGGTNVQTYVSGQFGWNTEVARYKQATGTNFKYGGPVNFQYNQQYIDYFVANANPAPDYVVWHDYAGSCGHNRAQDSQASMLTSIDHWNTDIQTASNDFATQNGGVHKGMPIIIDEWNYASDLGVQASPPAASPCYSADQNFITTFFDKAFNMFLADGQYGVIGSAEYEAFVGKDENLIDSGNTATLQGQAFKASYESNIGNTPTPPPSPSPNPSGSGTGKLMGVNFSGPEWNGGPIYDGSSYLGYTYFSSINLSLIRMPFLWERMQSSFNAPLNQSGVQSYGQQLQTAAANNEKVILDMHNYAVYNGKQLTTADSQNFGNAWKTLASQFGGSNYPAVWGYEVMNEPHDLPGGCAEWETLAQAAVNGIRQVDMTHYVLIPGYQWQSANGWQSSSNCLGAITDPANKLYYSAHQYFDANSSAGAYSGTYSPLVCPSSNTVGTQLVSPFLQWLQQNHKQGLLTEFGVPSASCWLPVLDDFMKTIYNDSDIVGATAWASWPAGQSYNLNLEPTSATQGTAQDAILQKYPSTSSSQQGPTYSCSGLTATPNGTNSLAFNFAATAQTSGGATLASADVTYGDGASATGIIPASTNLITANHTYGASGSYTAIATLSFTVSGATKTATCSTQVNPSNSSGPTYSGTLSANQTSPNSMDYIFTGQTNVSGGATFTGASINFGDGQSATNIRPGSNQSSVQANHTYTSSGTFTAMATFTFTVNGTTKSTTASTQVVVSSNGGGGSQQALVKDSFVRPNQSGWGTASDGQSWQGDANTNAAFSVKNNVAIISNTSNSLAGIIGAQVANAQIVFTGRLSSFNYSNFGGIVRYKDSNNWYKAYIDGNNLVIQKRVNGTYTVLKQVSFKANANTNYSLRFQADGTTLAAKVWLASGTEPSGWTATVTDNSLQSGFVGLRALPQSGNVVGYYYFNAYQL